MEIIFKHSRNGSNKYGVPSDLIVEKPSIPDKFLRSDRINSTILPDVSEFTVVRHYTALSKMNFCVDDAMYPLGSCTMKYNPRINEKIAGFGSFPASHPMESADKVQGCLQILHELSGMLCEITGMSEFSLSPSAGAHGELAGVMIMKKYFENRNENRKVMLIPDTAHGTNPATASMCGYTIKEVPSDKDGNVDMKILEEMTDENTAGMMLTSPNTLGLFDRNISAIAEILHKHGALFYCDGANFNAIMGAVKISDMGFDIMHLNLHKSFSTPHGGGGPGSGPVGVVKRLMDYLPVPRIVFNEGSYSISHKSDHSIGMIHSFFGNFSVLLRAWAYINTIGSAGLNEAGKTAVLNANYMKEKLKDYYYLPYKRNCMHEFVLSDEGLPNHITTNDISKRVLDYGFHAPTVYFPLLVHGAIMIEPTETESKESLDSFIDAMINIRKEINDSPELLLNAPKNTPVKRVDAVTAARKPVLRWKEPV